jgi:hypothetical protein
MISNKYELSGVYRLKCGECPRIYIGQKGRPFKTRYREHIRKIKNNGENSKFALHIQNMGHKCMNMEQTLEVLHLQHKGRMMNTLESYHIYEAHKQGLQLNEALIEPYNPIFEIITKNRVNCNSPAPTDQAHPTTVPPHSSSSSLITPLPSTTRSNMSECRGQTYRSSNYTAQEHTSERP